MKKLFIIVLYKQEIMNSATLVSLKKTGVTNNVDNKFIVWDNSNEIINNKEKLIQFLNTENIDFYHTPENISLAKIYNTCISNNKNYELICILDQDSQIVYKGFDSYIDSIANSNPSINIFLPPIYENGKLYSPGKYIIFKGFHYKRLDVGKHSDIFYTAITSGMIIRNSIFEKFDIKFNEDLTLYGIDSCFFKDLRKYDRRFYLMDIEMKHNLSELNLSKEQKKIRAKDYLEACLIIEKNNKFNRFLIKIYGILLKIFKRI